MVSNPPIMDGAADADSSLHARSVFDVIGSSSKAMPRVFWLVYAALWLIFGLYLGLNHFIESTGIAPWKPFVWELSSVVIVGPLVPFIFRLESQFRLDSRPRRRVILTHIAAALVFSVVHTTGMVLLRKAAYLLAGQHYDFGNVLVKGFYELQKDVITYFVFAMINFAYREFHTRRARELRARELAAELSEARLRHLTAQIEPHFLFNSLNAISNRMHEDVHAADRMISQLGDLLRAAYESDRHVLVPLERELEWLRGYAAMMAERFRGQLAFEVEVEAGLAGIQVPRLLLQPIVENAIRHGLADSHGWLRVDVCRQENRLSYSVSDDGAGFPNTPFSRGTGISNISRRLELLFPGNHSLEFRTRAPRGAVVTVSFPIVT